MPIHDWTRVYAGIFHAFHHGWIDEISKVLNRTLPPDYYALPEQIAGGIGPDVITLNSPGSNGSYTPSAERGGIALATAEPKVRFRLTAREDRDEYAKKAKVVRIRHVSDHSVVAVVEIVSQGNKTSRSAVRAFVEKAVWLLNNGVHLVVVDLFPPTPRDPNGLHREIWDEIDNAEQVVFPADCPLTLASYKAEPSPSAFIEPTAVGKELIDMPVFLDPDRYVPLPLAPTYDAAYREVPAYWRGVIEGKRNE
ncbi:MAG TPA: DUF4058 family protein [Fimbriiglobus sp.]|jgi:hypothetical protein